MLGENPSLCCVTCFIILLLNSIVFLCQVVLLQIVLNPSVVSVLPEITSSSICVAWLCFEFLCHFSVTSCNSEDSKKECVRVVLRLVSRVCSRVCCAACVTSSPRVSVALSHALSAAGTHKEQDPPCTLSRPLYTLICHAVPREGEKERERGLGEG